MGTFIDNDFGPPPSKSDKTSIPILQGRQGCSGVLSDFEGGGPKLLFMQKPILENVADEHVDISAKVFNEV